VENEAFEAVRTFDPHISELDAGHSAQLGSVTKRQLTAISNLLLASSYRSHQNAAHLLLQAASRGRIHLAVSDAGCRIGWATFEYPRWDSMEDEHTCALSCSANSASVAAWDTVRKQDRQIES
jgi:hypothetical protein